MQAKTHTAFPLIEFKSETYSPKIAVLSAVNKLKETEDKILQAKHREIVQKRIEESILAREEEKKKTELFKKMIRKSVNMQKDLKQQSQTKREKDIEKLHELNLTFRQSKFRFRQTVKSVQKQQNQKIYEQTKSQRERNEELVKQFKKRELQLKKAHRQRMSEREEKSKERVEQFRQSRIIFIQKERQKDVEDLEKKISSKTKYLQKFIQSQNDFANSRTRLRYKSNSSFNNDGDKSQSELERSNVGKIVENFKVNSMIVVNPEHEINENIFGLTESKKEKTIEQGNESQMVKKANQVEKVQKIKEKQLLQDEIKYKSKENQEKPDHKEELNQVKKQINDSNQLIKPEALINNEPQEKEQNKGESLMQNQGLHQNNKSDNESQEKKQEPEKVQSTLSPVKIKSEGFKESPEENANQ